jgi:protein-S-isoprenylcysteine O-methyltransferase Ste14
MQIIQKMGKLNSFGIGPKVSTIFLPWLAASIIVSSIAEGPFMFTTTKGDTLLITGIVLMTLGLVFYFSTAKMLLNGLRETRLITTGAYSFCQHPLYVSITMFIIPALSLILNSWLVLTSSLVGYILFKLFIKQEYDELEKVFGKEYLIYRKKTPEFFPFPTNRFRSFFKKR